MIKAIIFDCFGVILSDALSMLVSDLEATAPQKVRSLRDVIHAANRGLLDSESSTKQAAEILGLGVDEYRDIFKKGEVRDQKLLDFVRELRADYRTALLSNITKQGIERRFPDNELDQYFDVVVVSSDIGYAKPDEEAYLAACQRLGVRPEECVFTDDSPLFCEAARGVGMRAIDYHDFSQFKSELDSLLHRS